MQHTVNRVALQEEPKCQTDNQTAGPTCTLMLLLLCLATLVTISYSCNTYTPFHATKLSELLKNHVWCKACGEEIPNNYCEEIPQKFADTVERYQRNKPLLFRMLVVALMERA